MARLEAGQQVEVSAILIPPDRSWVGGYVFVAYETTRGGEASGDAIVRCTRGTFEGCEVRYASEHVRAETSSDLGESLNRAHSRGPSRFFGGAFAYMFANEAQARALEAHGFAVRGEGYAWHAAIVEGP